jgi:hypothetical protein
LVNPLPACVCWCPPNPNQETAPAPAPAPAAPLAAPAAVAPADRATQLLSKKTPRKAQALGNTTAPANAVSADASTATTTVDCWCVDPNISECYKAHYEGKCGCDCTDSEWVVLAHLTSKGDATTQDWDVDHSVRRFVRPVFMRDPVVWKKANSQTSTT